MPKPVRLVFDLDRTLFDTERFVAWLWQWLADSYGVDGSYEAARATDFYRYHGDSYDYLFFEHVAAIKQMATVLPDELVTAAVKARRGQSFLMPDVTTKVIADVEAIVTFGNPAYQRFKVALCPELRDVPCHITYQNKPEFIAALFPDDSTILIDDKLQPAPWPANVNCILLDRTDNYPDYPGERLTSLADL